MHLYIVLIFIIHNYNKNIRIILILHCSQIKKAHKMLSRFGIISWDFAVDENSEPILIEYNLNYPDVMIYQMNNGPLFGDLTQTILEDVREKLKKER